MSVFRLPDLGEGLQEAEVSEWYVEPGEDVSADQPLVSVETAKALVDIPSPRDGTVARLHAAPGDILQVGAPLIEFADSPGATQTEDAPRPDPGSVVGTLETGTEVANEVPTPVARSAVGVRTTPAVRALARRLDIDLAVVTPSGPNDTITANDVQRVARIFEEIGPLVPLRGVRRTMAHTMAQAHAEVVPVTIVDDADIAAWPSDEDIMLRLIRAIAAGCRAQPALNTWYDSQSVGRRLLEKIDLGVAVDTPEGLFVPVLRDVGKRSPADLRKALEEIKRDVRNRSIPPAEMRGQTFTLSNFGTLGARYAAPIVVPPTVAILGAGAIRDAVVAENGQPVVHRILPLSLTFDHRAVTGGEATRFLVAAIGDLERGD